MERNDIERLARTVDDAATDLEPIVMLTSDVPEMTLEDAYTIQRASIERRRGRGETVVGMKMGLTSKAKMEQMNVHNPIYGHLTDTMKVHDGDTVDFGDYIHPRVEPELAFVLSDDLSGDVGPREALQAVDAVYPALEIIDSRYQDFEFTLIDVIADNASSSGFVLGTDGQPPADLQLDNLGMVMSINGEVAETGSSAAILEDPARSLAALARMLHERDEGLEAGQIVLAGSATSAVFFEPGDHIELEVDGLDSVEFHVGQ